MYTQIINLLTAHDCITFTALYLILVSNSLSFFSFSTTLVIFTGGLVYYGSKLTLWISSLRTKEPVILNDWLDTLAHEKVVNLVSEKLNLINEAHCSQEMSFENETFRISENLCKDYIVPWCTTISPESAFPADAERAIFELIHSIIRKLSVIDPVLLIGDVLHCFHLMCSPSTRDKLLLSDDEMNSYLELCTMKVIRSCSPNVYALADEKKDSEGFNDPLISMVRELLKKAAIVPIFDLISDPDFLNSCIARLFSIKVRDEEVLNLDGIQDYPQDVSDSVYLPLKNLSDGTMRSISVDANLIKRTESGGDSSPEIILKNLLHKRSLSQPGTIGFSKKDSKDILGNSQLAFDSISCEAGIEMDHYANPSSRIFRNIRINSWEVVKSSKEMYISYVICLDALFEEVQPDKMYPSPVNGETREECIVSSLMWKNLTTKHRFREFVDLQVKLENNARLRGTLRGMHKTVIKPSTLKLNVLNFMSLNPLRSNVANKATIEHRRRCLEKYLNELCKFERISRSREFRDFLGYKEERSSFLRSPTQSILVPLGIDRVYRNVRDAITLLKPSNPQEGAFAPGPSLVISDSPLTCLKLTKLSHEKQSKLLTLINEPRFIQNIISSADTKNKGDLSSGNATPEICFFHLSKRISGGDSSTSSSSNGLTTSSEVNLSKDRSAKIPLVDSLINLIQTIFQPTSTWVSLALLTTKLYLGTTLERIFGSLAVRICCAETFICLLHTLHESIWHEEDSEEWVKSEIPNSSYLIYKLVSLLHCKPLFNYLPIQLIKTLIHSMFNTFQSKDHNKMFLILILSSLLRRSQI